MWGVSRTHLYWILYWITGSTGRSTVSYFILKSKGKQSSFICSNCCCCCYTLATLMSAWYEATFSSWSLRNKHWETHVSTLKGTCEQHELSGLRMFWSICQLDWSNIIFKCGSEVISCGGLNLEAFSWGRGWISQNNRSYFIYLYQLRYPRCFLLALVFLCIYSFRGLCVKPLWIPHFSSAKLLFFGPKYQNFEKEMYYIYYVKRDDNISPSLNKMIS